MKAQYGLCIVCEKDLMITCGACGTKKKGNDYTEVTMDLSNGSRMPIAVCLEHKDSIFKEDKKQIMDAVKAGWKQEQLKDRWTNDQMNKFEGQFGSLEIA